MNQDQKLRAFTWALIDALEDVRAQPAGESDWRDLNQADANLRRELEAIDALTDTQQAAPASGVYIQLSKAEIQSGHDRVRWAAGLIRQLPENHDGRNSWLLNYGTASKTDWIRVPQQAAPSQGAGEILDHAFDALATQSVSRYHVDEMSHGFWPNCVRAGDGTLELFIGHQKQCTTVARRLAGAFTDGAFAMKQKASALLEASAQREQPAAKLDLFLEMGLDQPAFSEVKK